MKQNKYDDLKFFDKYSKMSRSKDGLDGAGEWYVLKSLFPDFKNKNVLDLGCGYGWHCMYAIEHGANKVIGIDLSKKMLEVANIKNHHQNIIYKCDAIENVKFDNNTFDVVISSLTFHYIKDYNKVIENIYGFLKKGGKFIFSCEHPVFTAYGSQDWIYDQNGKILYFPVDNYYHEGPRTANFLGEEVIKYHRTLTTYISGLLSIGFKIDHIVEPQPSTQAIDTIPGMADEMRRPMMLIIAATKN